MENTPPNNAKKLIVNRLKSCYARPVRFIRRDEAGSYPAKTKFLGGLYDELDSPHQASPLRRGERLKPIQAHELGFVPNRSVATLIPERSIYGGLLLDHFGHFLLESLARAWYIKTQPGNVYFFKTKATQPNNVNELSTWQKDLLSGLVEDINRIQIVHADTVFETLIVPQPGVVVSRFCQPEQAVALQAVGRTILEQNRPKIASHEKVWLSRSALGHCQKILGETAFETALQNEGFLIFHPEHHRIAEQIAVMENASVIAGFTGSAFHVLLLAKNSGAKVLHFSRIKELNTNYALCMNTKGFAAEYYNFFEKFDNGTTVSKRPAVANVYQNLHGVWDILYQQGVVKTASYG